jgi:hypothetical protein
MTEHLQQMLLKMDRCARLWAKQSTKRRGAGWDNSCRVVDRASHSMRRQKGAHSLGSTIVAATTSFVTTVFPALMGTVDKLDVHAAASTSSRPPATPSINNVAVLGTVLDLTTVTQGTMQHGAPVRSKRRIVLAQGSQPIQARTSCGFDRDVLATPPRQDSEDRLRGSFDTTTTACSSVMCSCMACICRLSALMCAGQASAGVCSREVGWERCISSRCLNRLPTTASRCKTVALSSCRHACEEQNSKAERVASVSLAQSFEASPCMCR